MSLTQKRKNGSLRFVEVEMIDNFLLKIPSIYFHLGLNVFCSFVSFFFFYNFLIVFFNFLGSFLPNLIK